MRSGNEPPYSLEEMNMIVRVLSYVPYCSVGATARVLCQDIYGHQHYSGLSRVKRSITRAKKLGVRFATARPVVCSLDKPTQRTCRELEFWIPKTMWPIVDGLVEAWFLDGEPIGARERRR